MHDLIYEKQEPVEINMSEDDKCERWRKFISYIRNTDFGIDTEPLAQFISDQGVESFYQNKCLIAVDRRIQKGMKLVKAMKFYCDDEDILNDIQQEASRIIQLQKLRGTLCFSIHPLDFLSSSENTYKWRSCHALDGDYRSGNLSYMCDNVTIMVYIKGEDDVKLPRFPEAVPWNSKKWRCLFHIDKNNKIVWASRPYPFFSRDILDIILDEMKQFNYFMDIKTPIEKMYWQQVWQTNDLDIKIMGKHTWLNSMVEVGEGAHNFNDVLYSSTYLPFYATRAENGIEDLEMDNCFTHPTPIKIGAAAPCCMCGEQDVLNAESFFCGDCLIENKIDNYEIDFCVSCRKPIIKSRAHVYMGDLYYCDDCWEEQFIECATCGCGVKKAFAHVISQEKKIYTCGRSYCNSVANGDVTIGIDYGLSF